VKELLENGADPNVLGKNDLGNDEYPILVAVRGKFSEILDLLIQHKANVDAITPGAGTALHWALSAMYDDPVDALLSAGADPNRVTHQYTPLQNAAQYGDRDISTIEALLIAGADVNAKTPVGTALDRAMETGQIQTACFLLDAGADTDLLKDMNALRIQTMI
jgi:ankyrin repeat protein